MRAPSLPALLALGLIVGQVHAADAVVGPVADVSVAGMSAEPQAVVPGGRVHVRTSLTNAGPLDAANVVLRIAVPAHTTFVSFKSNDYLTPAEVTIITPPPGGIGTVHACVSRLEPNGPKGGGTLSFSLEVLVDATVPQGETIDVTATVPGVRTADALWCPTTTFDPAPENNTATTTFTVSGPADISVAASGSPDPVPLGGELTYTLEITNAGPYNAQTVTVSDWFGSPTLVSLTQQSGPAFTLDTSAGGTRHSVSASIAELAAGSTARFTLVVHVPATLPSWYVLYNDLRGASGTGDPDPGNDRVVVFTPVVAGP